jgi:hypothetical protein
VAISVFCDHCRARFKAADHLAGKRGRCPKCRQPITVPASEPQAEPDRLQAEPGEPSCPKCGIPVAASHAFCETCGHKLKHDAIRKSARKQRRRGNYIRVGHLETIRKTSLCIFGVAALHLLGAAFSFLFGKHAPDFELLPTTLISLLYSGIYTGLGIWSISKPFAASLAALILYCTTQIIILAINPLYIVAGGAINIGKLLIILMLIGGMKSGLRYRRYMARERLAADQRGRS